MKYVHLDKIEVRARQRSNIAPGPLGELVMSIGTKGLLSPPVVWYDPNTKMHVLVTGERRTRAIRMLHESKTPFCFNGQPVMEGMVPTITLAEALGEEGRFGAEYDENVFRVDLDWQDRAKALAAMHASRVAENPKQTRLDTGREISAKNQTNPNANAQRIQEAQVIAENLHRPMIAAARNATEAYALVLKTEEEVLRSVLAKRQIAAMLTKPLLEIRHGDLLAILPKLENGFVDLICADPPYGIDASSGGFRARTVHHHNYEDTVDNARAITSCILAEGFRVTKQRANLFLFTDIKHWDWLQNSSANMGWTPFRRPIVWIKSDSEGLAPWGSSGPRIGTEIIFYATKGQRGLLTSIMDTIRVNRVPRNERIHAAEKPVELIRKLIECSTLPGDFILDPCCGSGSTLVAAKETNRQGLGIERDDDYYNTAMANVHS